MNLLELRHVTRSFGGILAVNSLDFAVADGEVHGLIGPNGSGKSTTINLIGGIYSVSSGEIWWQGREISGVPPQRRTRMGLARTFQNIRLFRRMTVLENVMIGADCHNHSGLLASILRTPRMRAREAEVRESAMQALAQVGMANRAADLPGDLPYGHQRLVEIARALATRPKLLLLDEPAAGMNHSEKQELTQTIRHLNQTARLAIVLVEHDVPLVMKVCDRLTVLNFGTQIASGSKSEVRQNQAVIEAYLGKGGGRRNAASQ